MVNDDNNDNDNDTFYVNRKYYRNDKSNRFTLKR